MISGAQDRTIQFRRLSDWDLAELDQAAKLTEPIEFVTDDLDVDHLDDSAISDVVKGFELGRKVGQCNTDAVYLRGVADGLEISEAVTGREHVALFRRPSIRGWARVRSAARTRPGGGR